MRILVVEDEREVADAVNRALVAAGFVVELCDNGEEAWFRGGTEPYLAAIVDIGLPHLDGMSVLRKWRQEGVTMPVLLLTARSSWPERVEGIDAGADDYLTKPFQMEELLARLRALIRRAGGHVKSVIESEHLLIDLKQLRVSEDGQLVALSPLEFRLLSFLVLNADRVVSQEELASNIYFQDQEPGSNAVEVLIGRMRRKFATEVIQTRRGFGYVFAGTLK